MLCPSCGKYLNSNIRECPHCGNKINNPAKNREAMENKINRPRDKVETPAYKNVDKDEHTSEKYCTSHYVALGCAIALIINTFIPWIIWQGGTETLTYNAIDLFDSTWTGVSSTLKYYPSLATLCSIIYLVCFTLRNKTSIAYYMMYALTLLVIIASFMLVLALSFVTDLKPYAGVAIAVVCAIIMLLMTKRIATISPPPRKITFKKN